MKEELLFDYFPFISGETLSLSKIQPSDAEALVSIINDNEADKYNPAHPEFTLASVESFLNSVDSYFRSKQRIWLGIYYNDDPNELLGTVSVRNFDRNTNSCEVGFSLRPDKKGKGIASMALSELVKYLFETADLDRIQATVMDGNEVSERVLERCGFLKEGTARDAVYWEDKGVISLSTYSLLRKEYEAVKGGVFVTRNGELAIVHMSGEHYELMAKWLSDEKVLKYYDGRDNPSDINRVISEYSARVNGLDSVTPCIMREKGQEIGYLQFYPIKTEITELKAETAENPYGIDLFIGEAEARNRGLGPRFIRMISSYLFNSEKADLIISDPQMWNRRSINAFTEAGFTQVTVLPEHELHEGKMEANVIMHRTKE